MTIKNQKPLGKFRNPASNRAVMVYQGTCHKSGKFHQFQMIDGKRTIIKDFHNWGARIPEKKKPTPGISIFSTKPGRPQTKKFTRIYNAEEFGKYLNPQTKRAVTIYRGTAQKFGGLFIYAAKISGGMKILRDWNPSEWQKV
jgi:hypothetical protein